ncbi:MAG: TraB/GumN family protein [Sphingomonas sp.]|nr:TraB/GumN family protein [Sphingomonas sp.]
MLLKLLRRAAAFIAIPLVASGAAQAATTPRPALWEVSDPDTKIYLFGTIHLLPKNYGWRTRVVDRAIASADTLVVETIIDAKNPAELTRELIRLGYADGLPPLATRVAPAKRAMLEAAIAKTGIPRPAFDRMRTWAAAFTLLGVQFKELGLQGEEGVEHNLRTAFAAAGKPVGQLETNGEQLGFFNSLPEAAQRDLLEGAIEAPKAASDDFSKMLKVWASGDVAGIAKTFNEQLAASPDLMEALIRRRNVTWTSWIQRRLAAPGTVLFAVGAGHLAGPHSVQTMLERQGYKVRRIQ